MTLREINFNQIRQNGFTGLAIRQNRDTLAEGSFGEVLSSIPHLANNKVLSQRSYFNEWVIEIGEPSRSEQVLSRTPEHVKAHRRVGDTNDHD